MAHFATVKNSDIAPVLVCQQVTFRVMFLPKVTLRVTSDWAILLFDGPKHKFRTGTLHARR